MNDTTQTGAKPKGWFSRRHENAESHHTSVDFYLANRGPEARRQKAKERATGGRVVRTFTCGHRSSSVDHPCEFSA